MLAQATCVPLRSPQGVIWPLSPQIPAKIAGGHSQRKPPGEGQGTLPMPGPMGTLCQAGCPHRLSQKMGTSKSGHTGLSPAIPRASWLPLQPRSLLLPAGYPDHMVFAEFRRRFDVLAPHLTKKHGRNYIVVDEKRVRAPCWGRR